MAFILSHPAVTSVIIGPRTLQHMQSLLGVPAIVLDDAVLDAIDELVPPGITLNRADEGWLPPWLGADAAARRRPRPRTTVTSS